MLCLYYLSQWANKTYCVCSHFSIVVVLNHRYSKYYCPLINAVVVVGVTVAVVTMMTAESTQWALQYTGISQHLRISGANHLQLQKGIFFNGNFLSFASHFIKSMQCNGMEIFWNHLHLPFSSCCSWIYSCCCCVSVALSPVELICDGFDSGCNV